MATFNGIDYAIFILLFLSVAFGIARGFVKEIISLIAWVAAFVLSALYAVKLAAVFSGVPEHTANPIESLTMASIIISYLSIFIGVLICGSIVKLMANYLVKSTGMGFVNRFFGAAFGFARGCVIVLIFMFFIGFTALTTHSLWKDSKLVAVFHPGVKWVNKLAQPYIAQIEAKMKKTAKSLNEEDLSDVIKQKPAAQTLAPKAAVPAVAPAPMLTPVPAPAATPTIVTPAATNPAVPAAAPVISPVPASPSKP